MRQKFHTLGKKEGERGKAEMAAPKSGNRHCDILTHWDKLAMCVCVRVCVVILEENECGNYLSKIKEQKILNLEHGAA